MNAPVVADLIDSEEDSVHVLHQGALLHVLAQYLTDGVVETVEDIDENQLKQK